MGIFLADPTDVPPSVVAYVAAQLGLHDPGVLKAYAVRPSTQWEHAGQIQRAYGYREGFATGRGWPDLPAALLEDVVVVATGGVSAS